MKNYLLFSLYGTLSSWGDVAIGEARHSDRHPSKSAIMGLVAAAFGIKRHEEKELLALQSNLGFAVRVNSQVQIINDFHTTQIPKQKALKKRPHFTRKDELQTNELATVISNRQYCCEGFYTIILWERYNQQIDLKKISNHLRHPTFTLYLGRKSCPLCLPLSPHLCIAPNIASALALYDKTPIIQGTNKLLKTLHPNDSLYTEIDSAINAEGVYSITKRRDYLINRQRWQYGERNEQYIKLEKPGE